MGIPQPGDAFVLGVNYWPRRKAMYWWPAFDAGEVREEFAIIRELGLGLVRIFLLWDDWQPDPGAVSSTCLKALETVCDTAADQGLALDVTFFTGHMSGPSWAPRWMLLPGEAVPPWVPQVVSGGRVVSGGYANMYTDPQALAAAKLLLTMVVGRFRQHPAIAIWNLGNEPDNFARPPSPAHGRSWVRRMAGLVHDLDPIHPVTLGLHVPDLISDVGFRPGDVFAETDIAVMHGYPMYADWARGPLDPDFVPFLCALTSAMCGKPTLMEEFGGCTEAPGRLSSVWRWRPYRQDRQQFMASEEDLAAYLDAVLPRLVKVGALGAMLWCFADYAPELHGRPPCDENRHERFFGLVRPDGSLKPHAEALRRFAATAPVVMPASRRVVLDVSPEAYYADPLAHARRLYRAFLDGA